MHDFVSSQIDALIQEVIIIIIIMITKMQHLLADFLNHPRFLFVRLLLLSPNAGTKSSWCLQVWRNQDTFITNETTLPWQNDTFNLWGKWNSFLNIPIFGFYLANGEKIFEINFLLCQEFDSVICYFIYLKLWYSLSHGWIVNGFFWQSVLRDGVTTKSTPRQPQDRRTEPDFEL